MTGQCITCKFWDRSSRISGEGVCQKISGSFGRPDHQAWPKDYGLFMTRSLFGCRLYEIRPELGAPGSVATITEN